MRSRKWNYLNWMTWMEICEYIYIYIYIYIDIYMYIYIIFDYLLYYNNKINTNKKLL